VSDSKAGEREREEGGRSAYGPARVKVGVGDGVLGTVWVQQIPAARAVRAEKID
jgi:hypothetical protein